MFLGSNGEYSSILELMHYFYFEFNIYVILLIIVIVNCFKAIRSYKQVIKNNLNKSFHLSDIMVSILCEIALGNALMLQGVVADISAEASELWFNKIFIISVVSFVVFIVQVCFTIRVINRKNTCLLD